ncbi:MAG: coproporphyrinogen III oxidase, partial [Flavobacteriales bacterium]|nr:coproporphyrinogen III oxidase [Flavobacteriales bacterium]
EDFIHFHKAWSDACEPYGVYGKFKKTCDEYFVNSHRDDEMRGIGGIFYDHFNSGNFDSDILMAKSISEAFISSYFPIIEKRIDEEYNEADEDFQLHRRGRYVEFNLLHDRGTIFGLKTKGRTSSILISLPGRCKFTYGYAPEKDSPHEKMMEFYRPKDWLL